MTLEASQASFTHTATEMTMEPNVHTPQPIVYVDQAPLPVQQYAMPLAVQPGALPTVQSVLLPDGRVVTGYAMAQQPAAAEPERARVSPVAVNIALGGVGFAAVCGGLLLLTSFIAALAALVAQLVILAAVVFGGFIAVQVLGSSKGSGNTTNVTIKKAIFKRNTFKG